MMYLLVVAIIYFVVIMMMFAYIDNLYYNNTDIRTKKRTIYWNRVIVSTVVVFSISLLTVGILYNMRENTNVPENMVYTTESDPIIKKMRKPEYKRLGEYTHTIYPDIASIAKRRVRLKPNYNK